MAAYELTGKVKVIMDTQTFDSGFKKREFVVSTEDERYPQDICFEVVAEKLNLLDSIQPEQQVTVTFDIRGREYNGRYYNNLRAWKLVADAGGGDSGEQAPIRNIPADLEPDMDDPTPF